MSRNRVALAKRIARHEASAKRLTEVFDDSLSGDLARLRVRRRLMRADPTDSPEGRESIIQELLTP